jgi:hypothetical protein
MASIYYPVLIRAAQNINDNPSGRDVAPTTFCQLDWFSLGVLVAVAALAICVAIAVIKRAS